MAKAKPVNVLNMYLKGFCTILVELSGRQRSEMQLSFCLPLLCLGNIVVGCSWVAVLCPAQQTKSSLNASLAEGTGSYNFVSVMNLFGPITIIF